MSVFAQAKASRSRYLKSVLSGVAILGVGALLLSGCAPAQESPAEGPQKDLTLEIGTLMPLTGQLAFLGPPQVAGAQLAMKEINDANLGIKVNLTLGDEGDPENKAYATTAPNLINKKVSAIVGAAASGISKLVIDQITQAGIVQISPSNTSPDFTSWNDDGLYFRTAPSDLLQGEVLGNLIADDGASTLGIMALNDAYGTGLQKVIDSTFKDAGGEVVGTEFFNAGDTTYDAQISSLMAQKPDAIVLISFDQSNTVIPALKNAGFDTSHLYLVDGNTLQYGTLFPDGTMTDAKGTYPGPVLADDFQKRLVDTYAENNSGAVLKDFVYAGETYDAVVLLALAALAAQSTEGADIAAKMQEVSGGSGDGEKATDFKSAATIIKDGKKVDYDGYSGKITFDKAGDPTEATIGIFQWDAKNMFTRINK